MGSWSRGSGLTVGKSHAVNGLGVLVAPEQEHQREYEVERSTHVAESHPARHAASCQTTGWTASDGLPWRAAPLVLLQKLSHWSQQAKLKMPT